MRPLLEPTSTQVVRDLIHRYMAKTAVAERYTVNGLLRQSRAESSYAPRTHSDVLGPQLWKYKPRPFIDHSECNPDAIANRLLRVLEAFHDDTHRHFREVGYGGALK
jgi:hypothetical protein